MIVTFIHYILLTVPIACIIKVVPVWITSDYLRAGNENVIKSLTGSQTPTYQFIFKSALSGIPNLGYGIKAYQGNDYFGQQCFQIYLLNLTPSIFKVAVTMVGPTNLYILNVPYIAIDPQFPHHLNSFQNVPINYSAGPLTNITTRSTTNTLYYHNTINYTNQAYNSKYKTFTQPYENNKILLFMSSMFIYAANQPSSDPPYNPLDIRIDAYVISNTQYNITVSISINCMMDRLHFSMIIFDKDDVQESKKYMLVYDRISWTNDGGFLEIPAEFVDNFIMGLTDFSSNRTRCAMHFQWDFTTYNGKYGVLMPVSVGKSPLKFVINRVGFTMFYMKTWYCPDQTFFDPDQNICTGCPVYNCLNCLSLRVCQQCNQTNNYFVNNVTGQCDKCIVQGCIDCIDVSNCAVCDNYNSYYIVGTQCHRCQVSNNYFLNLTTLLCQQCSIPYCLVCQNLYKCHICQYNQSYYILANSQCGYCNNTQNNFINPTTLKCQKCNLLQCLQCQSLTKCQTCNTYNLYYLNLTNSLCQSCKLQHCIHCISLYQCQLCDQNNEYFVNQSTGLCQECVLEHCSRCGDLYRCQLCQPEDQYGLDYMSVNRSLCGVCNVSCTCDGYVGPWNWENMTCMYLCGDGMVRLEEQCDDNNTDNNDGCSQNCKIQKYYICQNQPSNCTITMYIQGTLISIQNNACNSFKITLTITPQYPLIDIKNRIYISNPDIKIQSIEQNPQQTNNIQIHTTYTRDLIGQKIILYFIPGNRLQISYDPTIPILFYTQQQCKQKQQIRQLLNVLWVGSYGVLFISLLSCKIIGLELFGVLQLAYFGLASHSFYDIYLQPLTQFKTFNGININMLLDNTQIPKSLQSLKLSSSFLNNCNIMLAVSLGQLLIAICMYIISKILNNQKLLKISKNLLKQGFITLVLFNIFNISFSAGVHWKYTSTTDPNYLLNSLTMYSTLLIILTATLCMQLTQNQQYGQFKNKFKDDCISKLYIPISIIYRILLGLYLSIHNQYQQGTLIILGISLTFLLYNIINLPFINVYQNYRACLCHITQFIILLVTNYYRSMKSNTPMAIKGRIHTPALVELVMIVICLGVSLVMLIYEIYMAIKEWRQRRTMNVFVSRQITEGSFTNLTTNH